MDQNIKDVPHGKYLQWVIEHPEQVAAYLERVKATEDLKVVVTKSGVTVSYAVIWSRTGGVVSINV